MQKFEISKVEELFGLLGTRYYYWPIVDATKVEGPSSQLAGENNFFAACFCLEIRLLIVFTFIFKWLCAERVHRDAETQPRESGWIYETLSPFHTSRIRSLLLTDFVF
jgi:hypothetical protein